jgi:hypothetical protein
VRFMLFSGADQTYELSFRVLAQLVSRISQSYNPDCRHSVKVIVPSQQISYGKSGRLTL